jgi:uncharacterized protein related to proFAR isomerase
MEIIPLITLEKRTILETKQKTTETKEIDQINEDEKVYVLDIDGIEKDKPNLCLYQKLSEHLNIWVDAGPRVLGDVVDEVMAGATNITVRTHLWPKADIAAIQEMTENDIYVHVGLKNQKQRDIEVSFFEGFFGLVVFDTKHQIEIDFKYSDLLRQLSKKHSVYVYESDPKHVSYWGKLGVKGLLVEINKIKEFEKRDL